MALVHISSHMKSNGIIRCTYESEIAMNKDRIVGAAKEIKGSLKAGVGEVLNDARLLAEGRADRAEGKLQKAVGVLKDTLNEADARLLAEDRTDKAEEKLQEAGVLKGSLRE